MHTRPVLGQLISWHLCDMSHPEFGVSLCSFCSDAFNSYIPINSFFKLDLEDSMLGIFWFNISLSRSVHHVVAVCPCVVCMQVTLMSVYLLKVSQGATVALLELLIVVRIGSTWQQS